MKVLPPPSIFSEIYSLNQQSTRQKKKYVLFTGGVFLFTFKQRNDRDNKKTFDFIKKKNCFSSVVGTGEILQQRNKTD